MTYLRFSARMRSPLSQIKLLAHHLGAVRDERHFDEERKKLLAAVEDALSLLRSFEEEATGKKQLKTPEF